MISILNTITNWLVLGLGVGMLILLFLYVWEKVLFKLLKLSRTHHKIFKYYRNKRDFEEWMKNN